MTTRKANAQLSFNNLRHFEEAAIGFRSFGHDDRAIQTWLDDVRPQCFAGGSWREAQSFRDLCHGRNIGGVELIQLGNVAEDGVQVARHAGKLNRRELKVGKIGDVRDVCF